MTERLKADLVEVRKARRELVLMRGGVPIRTYRISLGRSPVGHKAREGDGRTPEGTYLLDERHVSRDFHRFIHISYPAPHDEAAALARGVRPGGAVGIHGVGEHPHARRRFGDWTEGCIAVTNEDIEEIWDAIELPTPIVIRP